MSGQLGDLVVSLSADIARFREDMGKATKVSQDTAKQISSSFEGIHGAIEGVGAGLEKVMGAAAALATILAGGKMFSESIKATVDNDLAVLKLSKTLGVSTEEASAFKAALHSVGVDQEVAGAAALKMAMTLNKGSDAFQTIGVDIDGMRKSGKNNIEIMIATIQALDGYKGGLDKNQAAMSIFKRSWGEIQQLMKLTPEAFEEGTKTVKDLNMVVSPEKAAQAFEYKKMLRELGEISEAMSLQVGHLLVPELTKMGNFFVHEGPGSVSIFRQSLDGTISTVKTLGTALPEIELMLVAIAAPSIVNGIIGVGGALMNMAKGVGAINVAMAANPVGIAALMAAATAYTGFKVAVALSGVDELEADALARLAKSTESFKKKMESYGLDKVGITTAEQFADARQKQKIIFDKEAGTWKAVQKKDYVPPKANSDKTIVESKQLEYQKALYAQILEATKSKNDFELLLNQNAYTVGLTDLDNFLNEKSRLTQANLAADIKAKEDDLIAAQKLYSKTLGVKIYTNKIRDPEKEQAAQISAATKVVQAQTAVNAALEKQKKTTEELKESGVLSVTEQTRAYKEQQAAFLELQGRFVDAAAIRKKLDEESLTRAQLETSAANGNIEAIKALAATKATDAIKSAEAAAREKQISQNMGFDNQDIKNGTVSLFGGTNQAAIMKTEYDKKTAIVDAYLADMKSKGMEETENYRLVQEKKRLIDAEYNANKAKFTKDNTENVLGAATGLGNQLAAQMMQGNKKQFEDGKALAIAMATIDTGLAVSKALGSAPPPFNFMLAAIAGAAGVMNVAKISSTQYQARALGGPVTAGQTYIVNENRATQGPEYFTPGVSGTITPANKMGGQSVSMTQVLQISTGVADTVRAEIGRLMPLLKQQAVQAVQTAQRGGQMQGA